ncbi:MAG: WD40/YVTN/BNR-like repeat-containing protein [Anaerolineae bacterium]|jgi:photosystem II stability/assembly factor-like uncharacterized protein
MSVREYTSRRRWRLVGPVLEGGTAYALVLSPNREQHQPLIAGTPVGAFRSLSRGSQWSWANRGLTGLQVSALAVSPNGVLFLGALDGTLARSVDGGYSWDCMPPLEDSGSITALAVSPNYLRDGTILIGTEAGGVFRSTDSGRTTRAANFGLIDLTVLAVACAPEWREKNEVAFAGTLDGVFRSTNGGRAWRPSGEDLDGVTVQALAISPAFTRDGTVFAGTEEEGLYRSTDGGDSWVQVGGDVLDDTVNALWVSPRFRDDRVVLAGSASGAVYRSTDGGDSWERVLEPAGAVLALAGDEETVFAGFHGAGVYSSSDGGATWEARHEGLYANAFAHLSISDGGTLFVAGPDTGIYTSKEGTEWSALPSLPEITGLAALAVAPNYEQRPFLAVADAEEGVYVSADGGQSWERTFEKQTSALAAAEADGTLYVWAGTTSGEIALSSDGGRQWQQSEAFEGQAVLRIVPSPSFAQDSLVVAATRDTESASAPLVLWRSDDKGLTWRSIHQEDVELLHVNLIVRPVEGGRIAAVFDRFCLVQEADDEWRRLSLGMGDPPVLAVASRRGLGEEYIIVGSAQGVFATGDRKDWVPMMRGMGNAPVLALAPAIGNREQPLWALALGGIIWRWDQAE